MNILLVEDDVSKELAIRQFIRDNLPDYYHLTTTHSIMAGKAIIKKEKFDCVLLDMSLPLYDNDDSERNHADSQQFDPFGGTSILDEIDRISLSCKVIVITAYDVLGEGENRKDLNSLTNELMEDFPDTVICSIYYNASSNDWTLRLIDALQSIERNIGDEDTDSR